MPNTDAGFAANFGSRGRGEGSDLSKRQWGFRRSRPIARGIATAMMLTGVGLLSTLAVRAEGCAGPTRSRGPAGAHPRKTRQEDGPARDQDLRRDPRERARAG